MSIAYSLPPFPQAVHNWVWARTFSLRLLPFLHCFGTASCAFYCLSGRDIYRCPSYLLFGSFRVNLPIAVPMLVYLQQWPRHPCFLKSRLVPGCVRCRVRSLFLGSSSTRGSRPREKGTVGRHLTAPPVGEFTYRCHSPSLSGYAETSVQGD